MPRILIALLLLPVLVLPGCCSAGIDFFGICKEGPRGEDQDMEGSVIVLFDFGTMRPDSTASFAWLVKNVGDEAGTVAASVTDCEWVTLTLDPTGTVLQPGESAPIEAQMSFVGAPCMAVQCRVETEVR
jgi:hypothetical protein